MGIFRRFFRKSLGKKVSATKNSCNVNPATKTSTPYSEDASKTYTVSANHCQSCKCTI